MGEVKGWCHIVGPVSNLCSSFSFQVNVKFWNSYISRIVDLIDVKWMDMADSVTLSFDHNHDHNLEFSR